MIKLFSKKKTESHYSDDEFYLGLCIFCLQLP